MGIKKAHIYRRIAAYIAMLIGLLLLSVTVFIILVRLGAFGPLPEFSELEKIEHHNASRILSADGKLLGLYYYQNRTNTTLSEVPQTFIDGLIATEDVRFYKHKGFDRRAFFRVIIRSGLLFDKSSGGGSTISQQLAKNLYPRKTKGLMGLAADKVKEIITARRLEKTYSKEQILELYLNTVSFGENTFGLETASLTYFNKNPRDLSIEESALLVGLLKASTGYNPRLNVKAAHDRRNTVINQMVKYAYLEKNLADSLKLLPVELQYNRLDHIEGLAPYFREVLRHEVAAILSEINENSGSDYNLYTNGLIIHTTIHAGLQAYAEEAVKEQLSGLQKQLDRQWNNNEPWKRNIALARLQTEQSKPYQELKKRGLTESQILDTMRISRPTQIFSWEGNKDTIMSALDSILYHFGVLQSGLLAMDGRTGDVLAWVGGADYRFFKYDHVLAARQVGSTIKPLIYAAAIENGMNPCEYYENDSIVYSEFDNWAPRNADNQYGGHYSMQGALVKSINTISVEIMMENGIEQTIEKLQECGISAPLPEVPSLALGSPEIPVFQMVQAYSAFHNDGAIRKPRFIRKIEDARGNVIYEPDIITENEPVFSETTTQTMQAMLIGIVDRGTASNLRSRFGLHTELGGKTGTTQNQADGWFIGMTPEIIVGVWIGGASPMVRFREPGTGYGGRTAMPVFARLIKKISQDETTVNFVQGSFSIPQDILEQLDCEDFKESKSFFDFLIRDPESKEDRRIKKEEDDGQTRVGRFLRRIFGKKDRN